MGVRPSLELGPLLRFAEDLERATGHVEARSRKAGRSGIGLVVGGIGDGALVLAVAARIHLADLLAGMLAGLQRDAEAAAAAADSRGLAALRLPVAFDWVRIGG